MDGLAVSLPMGIGFYGICLLPFIKLLSCVEYHPLVGARHCKYMLFSVLASLWLSYFFLHWTKILKALNLSDTGQSVRIFGY